MPLTLPGCLTLRDRLYRSLRRIREVGLAMLLDRSLALHGRSPRFRASNVHDTCCIGSRSPILDREQHHCCSTSVRLSGGYIISMVGLGRHMQVP